jgi:hypothetical protein
MALVSSIVPIVCGLVLIVVANIRFFGIRQQIAAAEEGTVLIFGRAVGSGQLTFIYVVAMAFGLALIALGVVSLLKKLKEG